MGIGADVNLIVASLDLQLVRLLRSAMAGGLRAGDGAGGTAVAPLGPSDGAALPRRRVEPRPLIEPRQRIEPTPRFEPRPVIRPEPRFEPRPCQTPCQPELPVRSKSPLEPPWKVLPWEMPVQPAPKVKLITYRSDVVSKGSLIDFFI